MEKEIWKDIIGYEGIYKISSTGIIKKSQSYKSNKRRDNTLKLYKSKGGYLRVTLWKDGKRKKYYVHRLVAKVFNPHPLQEKLSVNHKNRVTYDNRVKNLEWVAHQININHKRKYTLQQVIDYTIDHIFLSLSKSGIKIKRPSDINHLAVLDSLYKEN